MKAKAVLVAVVAGAVGYALLQRLGRTFGATAEERRRGLPGDELMGRPMAATTHATTIAAPPEQIWPWLVQVGWHRGGWYTAEWVDRLLFPANWPSATTIVPALQHLEVGDRIPDGPPESGCAFVVTRLEAQRHLVLRSTTHLPPGWACRRTSSWRASCSMASGAEQRWSTTRCPKRLVREAGDPATVDLGRSCYGLQWRRCFFGGQSVVGGAVFSGRGAVLGDDGGGGGVAVVAGNGTVKVSPVSSGWP